MNEQLLCVTDYNSQDNLDISCAILYFLYFYSYDYWIILFQL